VEPGRVLVPGADAPTVRTIRACGHLAALPLSGGGPRGGIEGAVRIVRSLGAEGIVLGSDAGMTGGDLLALPRTADRLEKAGLSDAVVRRVCGENAVAFLGVDVAAVKRGPARRGART
jgi:predicted metal-dependent TIM-barrel fold hydrolase